MAESNQPSLKTEESQQDSSLIKLRRRWELASVLNFLSVFEPLIGKELKMSAEEIEDALINPNDSLAKLHICLLKGIRPFNRKLFEPDFWVKVLCTKLKEWWQRVAEGELPLTPSKGEEISRYKELDPTIRLVILKALCEIRTLQDDLVSYVNDELKQGAQISRFRKDKIGENRNGVSYWYDGNPVIGHRLYREVKSGMLKPKHRGKNSPAMPEINSECEILATNLDEFRKVSEKFSSCQGGVEAAVHETIETQVIPVLEKLQKNKERNLKRQQRMKSYLNGCHSHAAGVTRSCRTRRPVKYTFDDFDRTIDEAIKITRKGKGREVERNDPRLRKRWKSGGNSNGDLKSDVHAEEKPPASTSEDKLNDQQCEGDFNDEENELPSKGIDDEEDDLQGEGSENDEEDELQSEGSDKDKDTNCTHDAGKSENEIVSDSESDSGDFELESVKPDGAHHAKTSSLVQNGDVATGLQMKKSLDYSFVQNLREARKPEAKNRYRQRPTLNSAFDSAVVPDSEDESSSENLSGESGDASNGEDPSEIADSEDDISS